MNFSELRKKARLRLLKMHYEAKVGHIGGNLSALDSMLYLQHFILQESDQFILSKGHAAGALYVALWSVGKISDAELKTFHGEKTKLAGHPPVDLIKQIPFATGSLGHGLGLACGVALGCKLRNKKSRVFCLMSDGEWQEGSNFESLIFLNHHQLNVTILVDCNGIQGFGSTKDIASQDIDFFEKLFLQFNFDVKIIDGHDEDELREALKGEGVKPKIILMKTKKGHGISFMENKMEWHYLPLNEELYIEAINSLS